MLPVWICSAIGMFLFFFAWWGLRLPVQGWGDASDEGGHGTRPAVIPDELPPSPVAVLDGPLTRDQLELAA